VELHSPIHPHGVRTVNFVEEYALLFPSTDRAGRHSSTSGKNIWYTDRMISSVGFRTQQDGGVWR
jgi:hypothetical protein